MSKDRHELDASEIEIQTTFNTDDIGVLIEGGEPNEDQNEETEE